MSKLLAAFFPFALLFLTACNNKPTEPISIGINAWPGYEFLYLAEVKNFFKEEGANVRLVRYNSLSDARRAFERGQIDGMASTLIEVVYAHHLSHRQPQVLFVADYSNGADVILARQDINSVKDLNGKRIAVEPASLNEFILYRALQKHGLKPDNVTRIYSDQTAMRNGLLKGEFDAVVSYPPTSIELVQNKANKIFDSSEIPGEVVDIISLAESVMDNRRFEAKAIIRSWQRALDYSKQHPEDAFRIMAEIEGISPEEFREALTGLRIIGLSEQEQFFKTDGTLRKSINLIIETLGRDLEKNIERECCIPDHYVGAH